VTLWSTAATVAVFILAILAWRFMSLSQIPDIGSPFAHTEVVASIRTVGESDNAFVIYDAIPITPEPKDYLDATNDWVAVPESWKIWLGENTEALAMMEAGSAKPSATYCLPDEHDFSNMLAVGHHRALSRLSLLNASRCQSKNEMYQSWHWLRIAYRHSRHCGMIGTHLDRSLGAFFHSSITRQILTWASNPRVDEALLRQALDEVRSDFAMTPSPLVSLLNEYYFEVNVFDQFPHDALPDQPEPNYLRDWLQCEPAWLENGTCPSERA